MAPQFVKPYVKTNKHDAADAEAICEAVTRPNMRFVPVKTAEQQAVLALHRSRQSFIKQRTAQANQIRGLLAEFGIVVPRGIQQLQRRLPELVEDADNPLPVLFRTQLSLLQHHMAYLFDVIATLDKQIEQCYRQNALCQRIGKIPGIGPVTASALIATIESQQFREWPTTGWLGLVPRQHSSGGKQVLLGISKRGDTYLRTLLIHGAGGIAVGQT